jgi:hypothetical protein
LTEAGPVSIEVPRDREGSFDPQLVKKRQRRLTGLDDLVISLSAKGLTHGEICAHLAEVYGASVSKQTISTITDRVIEGMAEWQSRPLDSVYPVIFIDAVNVKIRDGNVANRPIYIALAVTVEGTRDILGLWAGEHGDGEGYGEVLGPGALRNQKPWRRRCLHGGLRRTQGPAHLDRNRLAASDHPDMHRAPAAQQLPLRLEEALGGARQGSQTDLHRAERIGRPRCVRRVHRGVGRSIPGDHQTVGVRMGGVCPVPAVRQAHPRCGLHDK